MRPLITAILAASLLSIASGCSTNPATGQSQLNMVSTQEEIQLGQKAAPDFIQQYGGEIPSPVLRQYVNDLGHRLAAVSERPELPWEFHAVDSSVLNAFALPGGKVFVMRGLLVKLNSEAMLAGVMGHECGHVTAQHISQQMTQQMGIQILGAGIGIAGSATNNDYIKVLGAGTQVGGGLYLLKFGRDQESQADTLGMRYMSRIGYNPAAQLQVMKVLKDMSGSGSQPEILSTHPLPQTRIDRLTKSLPKDYPDYDKPGKYTFDEESYKANVLDQLAKLPPPKHNPQPQ